MNVPWIKKKLGSVRNTKTQLNAICEISRSEVLSIWIFEDFSSIKIKDKSVVWNVNDVSLKWREHFHSDQQQDNVEYVLSSIWRHAWYFFRDGDLDSRWLVHKKHWWCCRMELDSTQPFQYRRYRAPLLGHGGHDSGHFCRLFCTGHSTGLCIRLCCHEEKNAEERAAAPIP